MSPATHKTKQTPTNSPCNACTPLTKDGIKSTKLDPFISSARPTTPAYPYPSLATNLTPAVAQHSVVFAPSLLWQFSLSHQLGVSQRNRPRIALLPLPLSHQTTPFSPVAPSSHRPRPVKKPPPKQEWPKPLTKLTSSRGPPQNRLVHVACRQPV